MFVRITLVATAFLVAIVAYRFYTVNFRSQKDTRALWDDYEVISKEVEGKQLKLVVADNSRRFQRGLMFVRKPVDFDGMIFSFKIPQPQVFWNRNTFEDLDVYWIRNDQVIGKSLLPSIEQDGLRTVSSPGLVDTVIEVIR